MKNTIDIIDVQYFIDINYFKKIVENTDVAFLTSESYLKTDFLNRCRIAAANGPILLSVPLQKGRSQRTVLKEVRISNEEKWQLRHWRAIISSYNGSPWFGYYADDLSVLYNRKFDHLVDWNFACFQWLLQKFKLDLALKIMDAQPTPDSQVVIKDLRKRSTGNAPQAESPIRYPQVFENKTGFIPNLSVLDLLFCQGPNSGLELLRQ